MVSLTQRYNGIAAMTRELIRRTDSNRNGTVDFTEYRTQQVQNNSPYSDAGSQAIFNAMDKNHDGKLSLKEVFNHLLLADRNRDGIVARRELDGLNNPIAKNIR